MNRDTSRKTIASERFDTDLASTIDSAAAPNLTDKSHWLPKSLRSTLSLKCGLLPGFSKRANASGLFIAGSKNSSSRDRDTRNDSQ